MNKYEKGEIEIKGLTVCWKLTDNESKRINQTEPTEEFKVTLKIGTAQTDFKFNNSIMEKEISQMIEENKVKGTSYTKQPIKEFRQLISKRFMWNGYNCSSYKKLEEERIKNLLYSMLHSFFSDINDCPNCFNEFCDAYGYDSDSKKAEKTFDLILDEIENFKSLERLMNEGELKFFMETVPREEKNFNEELEKALKF